jgi:hypothetical protein
MKKLAVCGCSFMTSSYPLWQQMKGADWPNYPAVNNLSKIDLPKFLLDELEHKGYKHNYSFLDQFVKEKNFDFINLARGGASNFFIRIQIDQAINENADYVIVGASQPERFEIPVETLKIENFREFNSKKYIMSTQIDEIIDSLPADLVSAIKYYKTFIQTHDIDEIKSYYILRDGLNQLEKKKIPYVFIPGPLQQQDWSQHNIVWPKDEYQPWDIQHGVDNRYNHNNALSHDDYFKTLFRITTHWK